MADHKPKRKLDFEDVYVNVMLALAFVLLATWPLWYYLRDWLKAQEE